MDELLKDFLTETTEHIEGAETQILEFEKDPGNASLVASIFRLVHTIKGTSGFLGLDRLQVVAHAAETVIGALRDGATATPSTITLVLAAIDRIKWILAEVEKLGAEPEGTDSDIIHALDLATEALAHPGVAATPSSPPPVASEPAPAAVNAPPACRTTIDPEAQAPAATTSQPPESEPTQTAGQGAPKDDGKTRSAETIRVNVDTIESIMQLVSELVLTRNQLVELTRRHENEIVKGPLQRLSSLTTDLQDAVMRARMQPVGRLYANLPRLVRELASELGKKLVLVTDGADTEIDRQLIDVIRDPLTHLIRNCADHGIEPPEQRLAAGKPETGEIRVAASHQAGQITITISDDGRGLNAEKIGAKLVASGRVTAEELKAMSREDVFRFIFEAGVSTAERVTNVSGRGVGMDVVRSNIESIGGTVIVSSVAGAGTTFCLKIPLTLAIAPALIIEAGGQRFALPQHAVVEVVALGGQSPHEIERVQNALILKLREEVLPAVELGSVLGLETEALAERLAIIIKVGTTPFAIIVDTVLDVQEIVVKPLSASLAHLKVFSGRTILGDGSVVLILDSAGIASRIGIDDARDKKRDTGRKSAGENRRTKLVLFRAGPGSLKALPLSAVARIETVEPAQITSVDGRLVMLRQSRLMPIVPISHFDPSDIAAPRSLLVVGQGVQSAGLLVDEIIDIVEVELEMQIEGAASACIGAAEIRGAPVEVLDIDYYLELARSGSQPAESRGHVLLVGGADVFHDVMTPLLRASGYTVASLTQPQDGESIAAESSSFDAVLLDLELGSDIRQAWLGLLDDAGLASERLIGVFASPPGRNAQAELASIAQKASRTDRQGLLNLLANVVDRWRDRGDAGSGRAKGGLAA